MDVHEWLQETMVLLSFMYNVTMITSDPQSETTKSSVYDDKWRQKANTHIWEVENTESL